MVFSSESGDPILGWWKGCPCNNLLICPYGPPLKRFLPRTDQPDEDNPLEIHDPRALWSGGLDVGRKASIQRSKELEMNRIEVRALREGGGDDLCVHVCVV